MIAAPQPTPLVDRAITHGGDSSAMFMADPTMSSLKDVQRELDDIKAERRRRQRELYVVRQPRRSMVTRSSATSAFRRSRPAEDPFLSRSPALIGDHASVSSGKPSSITAAVQDEEFVIPYCPEADFPAQLLRMAYATQPGGRLSPCSEHVMGDLVRALDLSPWNISAEQAKQMVQENRWHAQTHNAAIITIYMYFV